MSAGSVWVADFETTTEADYRKDGYVRVYLWHARELGSEQERIGYDVGSFLDFCQEANEIWFHNLKFDGSYILYRILEEGWERSPKGIKGKDTYDLLVTDKGQWMNLILRFGKRYGRKNPHVVKVKDSAKKFPGFSLERIASIYGIEGKSSLYLGYRGPDYVVTTEDIERVKGDTRILKVAMEDLFDCGMKALTMAGDALADYKSMIGEKQFERWFPPLSVAEDEKARPGYGGGWTFVNPRWKGRELRNIHVYDVNSMYPGVMYDCPLPFGQGYRHRGEPMPDEVFITRFRASFRLKKGRFPMIGAKKVFEFADPVYLTESDGVIDMTLTSVDYDLFLDSYDVDIIGKEDRTYYRAQKGMFKEYIDKWGTVKKECSEKGDTAGKERAKRYLNSLYGKFGQSPKKNRKVPYMSDKDTIAWEVVEEEKADSYLPIAMFVTSYAHRKILDMANAFGDRFVYADTDSVHVIGDEVPEGLDIDPVRLGAWKHESVSEMARYLRPKTYVHADGNRVLEDVKIAGCPDRCKEGVTWENFRIGAEYPGKLSGDQVPGGYCLLETTFRIKIGNGGFGVVCDTEDCDYEG